MSNRPGSLSAKGIGVDLKHNSYARYLARKKGKTICCCACTQLVTRVAGVTASSWPDIIPIGASIFGAGERQGIVIAVNKTNGEIKSFIIRSKYCITPYTTSPPSIWSYFVIPTSSGSNTPPGPPGNRKGVFMPPDPEALKIINYCK